MVHTIVSGLSGKITVDGASFSGVMPPFAEMSDSDIASVLNFLIGLPPTPAAKPAKFTPTEVKAFRQQRLTLQEISAQRKRLNEARIVP